MGSSNTDYSKVIGQQVAQANLPKSPLSQEYSNLYGSAAPDIMRALLNVQSLGNSYINTSGNNKSTYVPTNPSPTGGFGLTTTGTPNTTTGGSGGNTGSTNNGQGGNLSVNPNNPAQLGAGGGGGSSQSLTPNIPGYTGGFTQVYGDYLTGAGLNLDSLPAGTTIGDLYKSGQLTSQQIQSQFGYDPSQDPTKSPDIQQQYNDWINNQPPNASFGPAGPPSISDWWNQYGPLGSNVHSYSANDEASFTTAINNVPKDAQPSANGAYYLQNGQFVDASGNILGSGPNSAFNPTGQFGIFPNSSGGSTGMPGANDSGNSGVNISDNGLPGGVNIPGVSTAFGGDPSGGMQSLLQALGLSSSILGGQQALTNPGNLNSAGKGASAGLGTGTDVSNPINQLLSMIGGGNNGLGVSPQTNDTFNAIKQLSSQQLQKTQADTRESALQQGTARSTGESYAEAQNNAASIPALVQALSQAGNAATSNQLQAGSNNNNLLNTLLGTQNTQLGQQASNLFSGENAVQGIQNTVNTGNANNISGNQGLNSLLAQLGLGNSQQTNQYNTTIGGMNQSAAQNTINQQISILQQLLGGGLNLAGTGIPGSVSTSLSPQGGGNSVGGTLGGIGSLLGGLASFL